MLFIIEFNNLMKCLIPVLAMIIFMIQIHAIFIMVPPEKRKDEDNCSENQTKETLTDAFNNKSTIEKFYNLSNNQTFNENHVDPMKNSTPNYFDSLSYSKISDSILLTANKNTDKDKEADEDCSDFLINCLCKCGLAFLAGVLFSDMKFIKFGVI